MKSFFRAILKNVLILLFICFVSSCKSTKHISYDSKKIDQTHPETISTNSLAVNIINNAKTYEGVTYKYGGITNKGMDCSGLVYVAYKKENILLPRMSRDMAKKGIKIKLNEVKKGDLLFFKTNKNKNEINHVGLVISSKAGSIKFIHATTSNGVITSSLTESYWHVTFIEARRML